MMSLADLSEVGIAGRCWCRAAHASSLLLRPSRLGPGDGPQPDTVQGSEALSPGKGRKSCIPRQTNRDPDRQTSGRLNSLTPSSLYERGARLRLGRTGFAVRPVPLASAL